MTRRHELAIRALIGAALAGGLTVACGSSSSGPDASAPLDASSNDGSKTGDSGAAVDSSVHDSGADSSIPVDSGAAVESGASGDSGSVTDSASATETGVVDAEAGADAGSAEGGSAVTSYLGTQSPGDVWSWTLDHVAGTFSARDITTGYTYSGTLSQVTGTGIVGNGFTKLSIASTTDPAASSWAKQEAFAVEFPGTALLVSPPGPPEGGNGNGYYSKLIVAAAQGSCPTSGGTYNTVVVPKSTWENQTTTLTSGESVTGPGYGTTTLALTAGGFTLSGSTTQLTITDTDDAGDYTLADAGWATIPSSGFGCDGGQLSSATPGAPTIGVTPSGVLIEDMGTTDPDIAGVIGVQQTAVPSLAALEGDYLGFLFAWTRDGNAAQGYTVAVSCAPSTSQDAGSVTCQPFDSLDPVTPSQFGTDASVTIPIFFDSASSIPGLFTGHGVEGQPPRPTSQNLLMVTQVGGKGLIIGITGSGTAPALQDMMLIQQ
jgi:hypothetical protein